MDELMPLSSSAFELSPFQSPCFPRLDGLVRLAVLISSGTAAALASGSDTSDTISGNV